MLQCICIISSLSHKVALYSDLCSCFQNLHSNRSQGFCVVIFVQTGLSAVFPIPAQSLGLETNRTSSRRARQAPGWFFCILYSCVVLSFPRFPTFNSCTVAFHREVEFPYLVLVFSSRLCGWTCRTSVLDLPASQQALLPSIADLLL